MSPPHKRGGIIEFIKNHNKAEILALAHKHCEHRKSLIEHFRCAPLTENEERIGFVDIEASGLESDYAVMFCYCILDAKTGKIYSDTLSKEDIKTWGRDAKEDKRILRSFMRDASKFDRLIGHYSSRYDLPFLRTRAIMCGLEFPSFGACSQSDTWLVLRSKFKLSRNSLESGTRNLLGKTRKNHLSLALKNECLRGKVWAMRYTLNHCRRDVKDTRDLWYAIKSSVKVQKNSI